jgi:hypothetical protein
MIDMFVLVGLLQLTNSEQQNRMQTATYSTNMFVLFIQTVVIVDLVIVLFLNVFLQVSCLVKT